MKGCGVQEKGKFSSEEKQLNRSVSTIDDNGLAEVLAMRASAGCVLTDPLTQQGRREESRRRMGDGVSGVLMTRRGAVGRAADWWGGEREGDEFSGDVLSFSSVGHSGGDTQVAAGSLGLGL